MRFLDIVMRIVEVAVIIFAVFAVMMEANRIYHEACRERDKVERIFDRAKEKDE